MRGLVPLRFFGLLAVGLLGLASGALSLLLLRVPTPDLLATGHGLFLEDYFSRLASLGSATGVLLLRGLLLGTFSSSLLLGAWMSRRPTYQNELRGLVREVHGAWAALVTTLRRLTRPQQTAASALLLLILGLRAELLLRYGFRYDELLSYLLFVGKGPATVATFYPLPNNHVFYNLACTLLTPLTAPHAALIMRLPSYLAAAAGTALVFVLLVRFSGFRLAGLVTGLFNLAPPALLYAASGRGYYLQLVLMQLGFFAVVGLGSRPRYQRLGWTVFVVSSVLGLYTVPTYAYPLASLLLGLALVTGWFRPAGQPAPGARLLLAVAIIGATAALLYAPVGAVSGWARLLSNPYVQPLAWAEFRAQALANVYANLDQQFGLVRPVLVLGAGLLAGAPVLLWRPVLPAPARSLGWVAWAMLVVPAALVVAQRTYPPTRAVMYLGYFGVLLAALALEWAVTRWRGPGIPKTVQWTLLALLVLGPAFLRGGVVRARIRSSRHEEQQLSQAWEWLRGRQPRRVFLGSYQLFFYYYAVRDQQRIALADQARPGRRYDYLVLPPRQADPPAWATRQPYRCVFRNDLVSIFALPKPPLLTIPPVSRL